MDDTASGVDSAPAQYTVLQLTLAFASLAEARERESELFAQHLANSRRMHDEGELVLSGAFLDPGDHVETMAVLRTPEAAQRFLDADPFVQGGYAIDVRIRPWANMFYAR